MNKFYVGLAAVLFSVFILMTDGCARREQDQLSGLELSTAEEDTDVSSDPDMSSDPGRAADVSGQSSGSGQANGAVDQSSGGSQNAEDAGQGSADSAAAQNSGQMQAAGDVNQSFGQGSAAVDSGTPADVIYVHVCGAVANPGVYQARQGMRIFEAIQLAGGFAENADQEWLNQAGLVEDGQQLYVYTREETSTMEQTESGAAQNAGSGTGAAAQSAADGLISINTADRDTLMTLPGIGEAKADAIIQYRTEHGSFGSIEEIQNIPGIKTAVFEQIRDRITV